MDNSSKLFSRTGNVVDCLGIDNTIFKNINLEELEGIATRPKVKMKKFSCLSLKSKNDKENDKYFANKKISSKRLNESETSVHKEEKKMKYDITESQLEICANILEETFDDINVEIKTKESQIPSTSKEIDAFKNCFGTQNVTCTQSDFSQFLKSSQVVKQIDTAFDLGCVNTTEDVFKIPIELPKKNVCSTTDRLDLFHDEELTSQYRKEVCHLFEQIETSICLLGTNSTENKTLPNEVLDIIFTEDSEGGGNKNQISNIDWTDDTLMNAVGLDASFGTAMKQALLVNANKAASPQKDAAFLNSSISIEKPQFRNLGPFYGLPLKVKELIQQYKGIQDLYGWQDECLKLPAIQKRKNLIYALPTSGGKTLVAEILIFREIMCYKRNALLILPYVAIVQEKVWALSPFAVGLDFLVEEYASSKGTYPPRKRRRKKSVYIATIEKALNLINSLIETGRLYELGLVVVDELHLVGEDSRGCILESLLTKLMYLKANVHIVGMSATIGNLNDICTFLDADVYTKNFRPVELVEYVKCGNDLARVNWNHIDESDLLVETKKINFNYSEQVNKIDPDMLGGLVMEIVPNGSCLIFCATKKNCENVAFLLSKIAPPSLSENKRTEKEQLIHSLRDETGEICSILKVSIQFGFAYHHSGLTSDERRLIEEGFRAGIINVICCTSTLAAGVNLPAQRVILRSPYIGRDFINLSRYKQMVGRAGRAGLGETGDSVLITNPQDLPKVVKLLLSPMNQALSGMHNTEAKGLRHLLLSCISLGLANTRLELQAVTKKTLMAVQTEKLNIDVKKITDSVIKNLFKMGALRETTKNVNGAPADCDISVKMETTVTETESGEATPCTSSTKKKLTVVLKNNTKLVVSNLGTAAIKGGLELSRAHQLYDDLYQAQSSLVLLDSLHLLYLVTPYETSEQIRPNKQIYYHELSHLGRNELQTARILGINEATLVKMLSGSAIKNIPERVLNRFYVTLMLYDLWNGMSVFDVSRKFQINRGNIQNLMVNAATFASNVVYFCEQLEEFWAFSHLLQGMSQRLSHCCVKELLPLMELPSVKQGRAKQLFNAGYKNLQSIAKANVEDLMENIEFMPRKVANQLIAASKMLLLEKVENLREEAEDVLDGVENPNQVFNQSIIAS